MKQFIEEQVEAIRKTTNGKRILFACFPGDGHFNPLTGIAKHLQSIGYDVRFYASKQFADRIKKLEIPHYHYDKAMELSLENVDELFPGRPKVKGKIGKLNFDISNFFIGRAPEYFEDVQNIHKTFPFDVLIADCCFTAIPFIEQKMNIRTIAMGIIPLMAESKDLPPYGLGLVPSDSLFGKLKQAALRWVAKNVLFKPSSKVLKKMCEDHGLSYEGQNVFDYCLAKTTVLLQSATPGFEYKRSDIDPKVKFVGPLLPYTSPSKKQWFNEKLNKYEKVILVTQGTAEPDVTKLIKPTLEAFKGTDTLVVVTTAGSLTEELRYRYGHENIIIEDFIPYSELMPYVDVYVTNGGYGGTLLGIENELPMVVAGVHEGKSEICARVGYFKLGINLKTERPAPDKIKKAVEEIFANNEYKVNVCKLADEFRKYDPNEQTASFVQTLLAETKSPIVQTEDLVY